MTQYLVTWSMPIEADDAVDAAQQALGIHRDPQSIATVFFVESDDPETLEGRTVRVDLNADGTLAEQEDLGEAIHDGTYRSETFDDDGNRLTPAEVPRGLMDGISCKDCGAEIEHGAIR